MTDITAETKVKHSNLTGELLLFRQDGAWRIWRDNRTLPNGTELLVIMPSLRVGWLRWLNAKLVDQVMGKVADGFEPPRRNQLPDPTSWSYTSQIVLIDTTRGDVFTFATSSGGGDAAIRQLCRDYAVHCRVDPHSLAVVELSSRNYRAHGKTIFEPVLKVVTWR